MVELKLSSRNDAGSAAAVEDEGRLRGLLGSGVVGNMPVAGYTLLTNGGSNDISSGSNGDSSSPAAGSGEGLSLTAIVALAVCIPVVLFGIFYSTQVGLPELSCAASGGWTFSEKTKKMIQLEMPPWEIPLAGKWSSLPIILRPRNNPDCAYITQLDLPLP